MTGSLFGDFTEQIAAPNPKPVEIYLDACSIGGVLESPHARVSDFLGSSDDTIRVTAARVIAWGGKSLATQATLLVNKRAILLVADLSPAPATNTDALVEREPHAVTLNVGPIWIQGNVHLPVGGDVQSVIVSGPANRFLPLTDAVFVGHEDSGARTVLVNRDHLHCMLVPS
jgi:hypothetical protein